MNADLESCLPPREAALHEAIEQMLHWAKIIAEGDNEPFRLAGLEAMQKIALEAVTQ